MIGYNLLVVHLIEVESESKSDGLALGMGL